jgi:hypothetical protein
MTLQSTGENPKSAQIHALRLIDPQELMLTAIIRKPSLLWLCQ